MSRNTHKGAALALATALVMTPALSMADDDFCERDGWGRPGPDSAYSMEEIGIMSKARALKRYGPGAQASVHRDRERNTYRIEFRDRDGNLMRETELNRYGCPLRDDDD